MISIPAILKTIAFNPASDFNKVKDPEAIRVLSWNVGLMNLNAPDTVTAIIKNLEILDAIRNSNADVLCLQEFLTSPVPDSHYSFLDSITRTMNYPFRYYVVDYDVYEGFFNSGTVIYSRYPFSDTSASRFKGEFLGSVLKTGIIVGKDTIDIISTRMQSLNFKHNEYEIFRKLKQGNPVGLKGSKNLFSKLKYAYQQRGEQVLLVRNLIENSNRPHIFTGDLNDIPTSYSYKEIKGKMRDAWLHHGWGPGRTFRRISPTLRIDFIFYSTHFKSLQAKRILTTGSDHYGLITDVQLKR